MCAVLAVAVLWAYCMSPAGGSVQAVRLTVASQSASASSAPAPSPAEGHSPRLLQELSGPLTGTGEARPNSAVHMSTAMQQATSDEIQRVLRMVVAWGRGLA